MTSQEMRKVKSSLKPFLKSIFIIVLFINMAFLFYTDEGHLHIIQYMSFLNISSNVIDRLNIIKAINFILSVWLFLFVYFFTRKNEFILNIKTLIFGACYSIFVVNIHNSFDYMIFLSLINFSFAVSYIYSFVSIKRMIAINIQIKEVVFSLSFLFLTYVLYMMLYQYFGFWGIPPYRDKFTALLNDTVKYRDLAIMIIVTFNKYFFYIFIYQTLIYFFQKTRDKTFNSQATRN